MIERDPIFPASPLDNDDGSQANPVPDVAKMTFADPAALDALISAVQKEASAQGMTTAAIGQGVTFLKAVLPALTNVVAPGSAGLVTLVLNAIPIPTA